MKIAVVGAGAIGGFLGARLVRAGTDVVLIARGPHLKVMQESGLRVVDTDGHEHRRRAVVEGPPRVLGEHGAAAEREHVRLAPLEQLARNLLLDTAKARLTRAEELRHGRTGTPLDLVVEVEKRPPDSQRNLSGERRFAGAHEAHERDVPCERP